MQHRILGVLVIGSIVLTACSAATPPAPTATSVLPTETPKPTGPLKPTDTAVPPKATEIASPPTETHITIDGRPDDWAAYPTLKDPSGDNQGGSFDIAAVRAFANDKFLYVLVETHSPRGDYVQLDLEFEAGGRRYVVSFNPERGEQGFMGDATDQFVPIGEVAGGVSAADQAIEFKMPLSAFKDTTGLTLRNVRPMAGKCCGADWRAIDETNPVSVAQGNEIEPKAAPWKTRYAPGSAPVIGRIYDPAVRGDEPYDIVISPDGKRAFVPARNTDNLFVIDLTSNQIIAVIDLYPQARHPLGPAPERVAITPDGSRLLVTNANDDSLTVIDTATNTVVKTLRAGQQPSYAAISPDGSLAYVPNKSDNTMSVIAMPAAEALSTINLPGGGGPFAATFSPDGSQAYVAMQDAPVYIINPVTHAIVGSIPVPDAGWTGDLVISPDGHTGYLASLEGNKVIMLDLLNRRVANTFEVVMPEGLALSADGSRLYVGTFGFIGESKYNLWMFDAQSGKVIAGVNFKHPAPYGRVGSDIQGLALTPDGKKLYAASVDADGVFVVDPATLEPRGMILTNPIANYFPLKAVVSPDGAYLYVASAVRQPTTVRVIDTKTQQVVGTILSDRPGRCAGRSMGLDISPDGRTLYVLSSDDNCVLVIDSQSRVVADSLEVGTPGHPLMHIAVHPDGGRAYVLDSAGSVFVVDLKSQSVHSTLSTVEDAATIKLSPDGKRGYVGGGPGFAVLDLSTDKLLSKVDFGKRGGFGWVNRRSLGIKPNSSQYVVGEFFNMRVYDAISNKELRNIDLRQWNPFRTVSTDVIFSPDGKTGYLAMWDEKAVIVFNANTWQVTAKIDVGRAPYFGVCPAWLAQSPDGGTLYAVSEEGDNVVVIDTATNRVTGVISLLD
jgi:YVTN family beta-propeller protein